MTRHPRRAAVALALAAGVVALNAGPAIGGARYGYHEWQVRTPEYKAERGSWSTMELPEEYRVNAIHAALLKTGKVLVIAGSGNDEESFDAGTFRSILWDPATDRFTEIPTPADMFCAGHAFLPDGRLLVAGGTQRYELLGDDVVRAAGAVSVRNEDPDAMVRTFPKGTRFTGPNGKAYQATSEFTLPPATKVEFHGGATVTASEVVVWAEALEAGEESVTEKPGQFTVEGLEGSDARNIYGMAEDMTLDKQDFQGTRHTYVFDPDTERYERVEDMAYERWYPSLVPLADGTVLASSGLDGTGRILEGQTEVFDPKTMTWGERIDLTRYFPTYPWLFPAADGRLFYSGSNSGYGPADEGRRPGFWDLTDNSFTTVPGPSDADLLETSGSIMLPPVQEQRVMVVGGGGVGESPRSTTRTATIDLDAPEPRYVDGPDLQAPTRYPHVVNLPDDTTLISGGSSDYRGKGDSDNLVASLYDARTGTLSPAAPPRTARNYHSEALLLPDGRVVVLGSDPLFADARNTIDGTFEQRLEIYSPPYLFQGEQPVVVDGDEELVRGGRATFELGGAGDVASAKLMRPSAVTHATDLEQRTVALDFTVSGGELSVEVPAAAGIAPDGWYMFFVTDSHGVPSRARWVHVSGS
ncbi:galactose oxidase early set domain-containing protein [Kineococcus xinjiangensis]|uniref:galactose oxidase early set domain-containing protein n=1 Tax=Kineococcus xinjiangensis TaxID=512762 RepID=UPI000CEC8A75|nr:galactose oxidase early set domain-containing protein [Kineococcus xinjiangensis]